jgi:hypothetical protein
MKSPAVLLKQSEDRLNAALRDYEVPPISRLAREFYELRVQAAIFNYDVSYDTTALWQAEPSGFAEKLALKNLVHRLYEYDQLMQKHLVRRLLQLAKERRVEIDTEQLKTCKKKWKEQFKRLQGWSAVRNKATGHYGSDLKEQVSLLQSLQRREVMDVVQAFLSYNIDLLNVLKDAGARRAEA